MTLRILAAVALAASLSACALEPPPVFYRQPPALVPVGPGVEVVPGQPYEVFHSDGWYWTRWHNRWFRAHEWRGHWRDVDERYVPRPVVQLPRGRYRYWVGRPSAFGRERAAPSRPIRGRAERRRR